jgi:hypothetical protein
MSVPRIANRVIGSFQRIYDMSTTDEDVVPLAIVFGVTQAALYDVPGGYRAVMFDRFSGVNDKV